MHGPRTLAIALTLGLLGPMGVRAQAPEDGRAAARELAVEAHARFEAGDADGAVELLLEARATHPEPVLLYNLGRAYEASGRLREAIDAYERFVEEAPDAPSRAAVELTITSLRRSVAERERLIREAEAARAREGSPSVVPWLVAASGAGGLAAGGVLAGVAVAENDAAAADPVQRSRAARAASAQDLATAANVLFVVGGALALTAGVWWLVEWATSGGEDESAALEVGPGVVRGRF